MALGGVFMIDTDGNIGQSQTSSAQQISGLLFDVSASKCWDAEPGTTLKAKLDGKVVKINSLKDFEKLGDESHKVQDFLHGIPYYHVKNFFARQGAYGTLYIMFADCKTNWDAVTLMQNAAHGMIHQLGVWTEQSLWDEADGLGSSYKLQLVGALNTKAQELSDENAPLSILLSANSAMVKTTAGTNKKVDLSKIPSCKTDARYVSVVLGQDSSEEVHKMHYANKVNGTPVGCVGLALGCVASANVHESIAWVNEFNLINMVQDIEFGFGDMTEKDGGFTSVLHYASVNRVQLDELDDKGYMFLCKYQGLESGVFFSKDQTCAGLTSDYRTIARNRTIHKSRRAVRRVLLPYVHSPLKVDPATGMLHSAQITEFHNIVSDVLESMQKAGEISGYSVNIDKTQNVLKNDTLYIKYVIVPIGVASKIEVEEGLNVTNK